MVTACVYGASFSIVSHLPRTAMNIIRYRRCCVDTACSRNLFVWKVSESKNEKAKWCNIVAVWHLNKWLRNGNNRQKKGDLTVILNPNVYQRAPAVRQLELSHRQKKERGSQGLQGAGLRRREPVGVTGCSQRPACRHGGFSILVDKLACAVAQEYDDS